ncbi:hypothetical protein ACP70R_049515 [Stipagrostis hirtigluma subsp. patula]
MPSHGNSAHRQRNDRIRVSDVTYLMGKKTRRRKNGGPKATPTTVHDVPDHLLKLVLLRLDSHVCLLRAAASCKRWRRIAAGSDFVDSISFFRRHPRPHVLGHYHVVDPSYSPGHPLGRRLAFVPATPATVDARHFALDFLPRGRRSWDLVDGCGSLLLLANHRRGGLFPDLVVCEPITRRFVRIDPIAGMKYHRCLGVFLGSSGHRVSMKDFTVTVVLYEHIAGVADDVGAVVACIYRDRGWRNRWDMKQRVTSSAAYGIYLRSPESVRFAGRSAGLIFWGVEEDGTVLAAAEFHGGDFRYFGLPDHVRASYQQSTFRFVSDGVEVYFRAVQLASLIGDEFRVYRERKLDGGDSIWELQRSLCLPEATCGLPGYKQSFFSRTAKIVTAGEGYVVLTPEEETWLFSIELRTMQVERKHSRNRLAGAVYPYELWSPPVVRTCVARCKRQGLGWCSHICICS